MSSSSTEPAQLEMTHVTSPEGSIFFFILQIFRSVLHFIFDVMGVEARKESGERQDRMLVKQITHRSCVSKSELVFFYVVGSGDQPFSDILVSVHDFTTPTVWNP